MRITTLILAALLTVPPTAYAQAQRRPAADAGSADQLVQQLGQFPAALPATASWNGRVDPVEERRTQVYVQLRGLGAGALAALERGLVHPDVQVRRNVALFLNVAAGGWHEATKPKLDIQGSLPALIASLKDEDQRVRAMVAQAIGTVGPNAAAAVPALIAVLSDAEGGARDSACIALAGIGSAAGAALPALRQALANPSSDLRRFAQRAIEKIEAR